MAGFNLLLLGQFLDLWSHRFRPDGVAFLLWMEAIGHDFFGEDSVLGEEGWAEVEVVHGLAIVEIFDVGVNLFVEFAELIVWLFSAREDGEEEDFCFGAFFFYNRDDFGDSLGSLGGVLLGVAGVVCADHDDGELGIFLVLEISILEAPDDVLGAVARDAKIEGIFFGIIIFPDCFSGSFPTLGDGVTDEEDVVRLGGCFRVHAVMALKPPRGSAGFGLER